MRDKRRKRKYKIKGQFILGLFARALGRTAGCIVSGGVNVYTQ